VQPGNCFANRRPAKEEILARIRYRNQRAKPVVPIAQGSGSVDEHGAMNGGSRCKSCGIAQSPITSGPGTVCVKSESADNRLRRSKKPHKRDSRRQRDRVGTPTRVRVLPKRSTSGRRCCNAPSHDQIVASRLPSNAVALGKDHALGRANGLGWRY